MSEMKSSANELVFEAKNKIEELKILLSQVESSYVQLQEESLRQIALTFKVYDAGCPMWEIATATPELMVANIHRSRKEAEKRAFQKGCEVMQKAAAKLCTESGNKMNSLEGKLYAEIIMNLSHEGLCHD